MTTSQKVRLCDTLGTSRFALEKAQYVMQELLERYEYDPNTEGGRSSIIYEFSRMRAFAFILNDLLYEIDDALLRQEWVEEFEVDGEVLEA